QLKRDLPGVSQKMLTAHLRELASDGLIERVDWFESPRGRHDYPLCGIYKGHSIIEWPFCLSVVWPTLLFLQNCSSDQRSHP
ncbi:winged helix-turn-helix transcriptional regulator, partial [Pseudomonas frederiksbergensis]|uniref:winged helix-turn-helix transcriptional regulator n=1 Tax=Pseudomonas frederiksbergensis TaxID=104087 RepID=UPI003D034E2A